MYWANLHVNWIQIWSLPVHIWLPVLLLYLNSNWPKQVKRVWDGFEPIIMTNPRTKGIKKLAQMIYLAVKKEKTRLKSLPVYKRRRALKLSPQFIPNASPIRPQSVPKGSPKRPHSVPKASPKCPQSVPNAFPMCPQCVPNASPMYPQCIPNSFSMHVSPIRPPCVPKVSPKCP